MQKNKSDSRPPRGGRMHASLPPLPVDSLALTLTVAAETIAAVRNGQALNDGLLSLWRAHPDLDAGARGAVQDMVFGTLRDYGRADFMLSRLLQQPLTEPTIGGLLRVALHRLEARPESAHTVVDQAVEAAARIARGGLKGLVNGVLRSALRQWEALIASCEENEQAHWRHPTWWIRSLRRTYPERWQSALTAGNQHPPMTLRVNRRRTTREAVITVLEAAGHEVSPLGNYALKLIKPVPIASLPGFAEGLLSVQDWGAQQAASLLDLKDGQRVLDACAAPGGKTAQILETADVSVTALDIEPQRIARVSEQLLRLGLSAEVKAADCRESKTWWNGQVFDRILADVPCSASGVVRRHPDIKWLRRQDDVANFATVQRQILDALWPLLAPGGKMLYLTCSVFSEENSLQVARFSASHPDCHRASFDDGTVERQWLPSPDHDGFFFALLEKLAK